MSTEYHIACLVHGERMSQFSTYEFRDERQLLGLIADGQLLEQIARRAKRLRGDHAIKLEAGLADTQVDLSFFLRHAGCELRVISEYGDIIGSCAKRVLCPTCGHQRGYCRLDPGHEGECQP